MTTGLLGELVLKGQITPLNIFKLIAGLESEQGKNAFPADNPCIDLPEISLQLIIDVIAIRTRQRRHITLRPLLAKLIVARGSSRDSCW